MSRRREAPTRGGGKIERRHPVALIHLGVIRLPKARLVAALLALPIALAAPASAAAPKGEGAAAAEAAGDKRGDDKAMKDAQARFGEGLRRYKKADFEGARVAFLQAYAAYPSADILWNLCLAEARAGRHLEALKHLRQYDRDPRITAADRARARKHIDEARAKTGHLRIDATRGAAVLVGDEPVGEAPFDDEVDVEPGKHVVTASIEDRRARAEVDVAAGAVETVTLTVEAPAMAEPPPATPAPAQPDARERSSGTARTLTSAALVVAGAATVTAGVLVRLSAGNKADEADALRTGNPQGCLVDAGSPRCQSLASAEDSRAARENSSMALLVGGSALVVGGVVTYLVWPKSSARASAHVLPSASPSGGSLVLSGSF